MTFCVGKLFRHEPHFLSVLFNSVAFISQMSVKHMILEIFSQPRLECSNTQRARLRARFRDTLR